MKFHRSICKYFLPCLRVPKFLTKMIKLVLLDPHPVVQKGFKSFFKKTKNIVVNGTFTTIKELVNFLNENTPDVVVLEMELPDGSAVDIIREIKKNILQSQS